MQHLYRLLLVLIWKNALSTFRNSASFLYEFIYVIILVFFVVWIRFLTDVKPVEEKHFNLFSTIKNPGNMVCNPQNNLTLVAFSPSHEILSKMLQEICPQAKIVAFESSAKLDREIDSGSNISRLLLFAVSFNDELKDQDLTNPFNYEITLRLPSYNKKDGTKYWLTESLLPARTIPGARLAKEDVDDEPSYQNRGFLYLQEKLTRKLLENSKNVSSLDVTIHLRKFPYPKWSGDIFYIGELVATRSLMIAMIYLFCCWRIAVYLTTEKESQINESMKQMGIPGWLLWTSWFLHYLVILMFYGIIIVFLFFITIKNAPVFKFTDKFVFFTFLVIASCPTITFAFLLSTLFSKASNTSLVGSFVILGTVIPYIINLSNIAFDAPLSLYPPVESLLFLSGICYASLAMQRLENIEEGMQWDNFMDANEEINFGVICIVLLIAAVLYMLLALYIEAVFPGEFGSPQPWNFFLTSSYWQGTQPTASVEDQQPVATSSKNGENIEDYTGNLPKAVKIRNLSKAYGSNFVVKNLNLDMYENHITVLLGHNGAGKTTTVSMISGMILPTGGTIEIYGYDLKNNTYKARSLMGVCPQHNVHFNYLTVAEHLYFFSVVKGVPEKECKEQVETNLKLIDLEDKKDKFAHTLSGGMKRKLSVGIAICGNSKLIVLDEPTAGLDPGARRTVWSLLQSIKKGRAILLITHYMDEADLLGDRIGIMTAGKLECMGTSFFLKKRYSTGYNLIFEVTQACQPSQITGIIRGHISSAKLHSYTGTELTYELSGREISRFPNLLKEIESRLNQLGIKGYGVSPASLEQIFLKVGADQETKNLKKKITGAQRSPSAKIKDIKFLYGVNLWTLQIFATFMKKIIYVYRFWLLYLLTQIILPIVIVAVYLLLKSSTEKTASPALNISIDTYSDSIFFLSGDKNNFYNICKQYLNGREVEVSNPNQEIIKKSSESFLNSRRYYVAAASFEKTTAVAWFNSIPLHSPAVALSLILNTILKAHLGAQNSINFINYPLPLGLGSEAEMVSQERVAGAFNFVVFPVTFVIILFYIKERACGAKHLQFTSGLNTFIYWGVSFIFDYIIYLIACFLVIATAAIVIGEEFTGTERIRISLLILVCFGVFIIVYSYCGSFILSTVEGGVNLIFMLFSISLAASTLIPLFKGTNKIVNIIELVLCCITPFYLFSHSISKSEEIYFRKKVCEKIAPLEVICKLEPLCCGTDYYAMDKTGIGRQIAISLLMSLLLFTLIILYDLNILKIVLQVIEFRRAPRKKKSLEEDVQAEEDKIKRTDKSTLKKEYILILKNVTKYYYCTFLAVNNISVGVRPFECFGLLGTNGAGKTTTFRMMTGDILISSGDIWISGYNVKTRLAKVRELLGYCPQFSAVLEEFTTREVLNFFALINGIPLHKLKDVCEYYAETLDFTEHLNKKVSQLSGGNKRKLSVVIALIGNPTILFLDEPTAAMDPATKRSVWNAIAKVREEGKSIILTSHAMEECEALCTKVAVMVKGTFQCLGSTQRLKNKFAQGYTIKVKLKKSNTLNVDADAVINFVTRRFDAALLEQFQELLTFQITDTSISCSRMFQNMEEAKASFNIEDYSIQQCSLEEVFLSLTEKQK